MLSDPHSSAAHPATDPGRANPAVPLAAPEEPRPEPGRGFCRSGAHPSWALRPPPGRRSRGSLRPSSGTRYIPGRCRGAGQGLWQGVGPGLPSRTAAGPLRAGAVLTHHSGPAPGRDLRREQRRARDGPRLLRRRRGAGPRLRPGRAGRGRAGGGARTRPTFHSSLMRVRQQ